MTFRNRFQTVVLILVFLLSYQFAYTQSDLSSFLKNQNEEEKTDVRLPSKSFLSDIEKREKQKSDLLKRKSTFSLDIQPQSLEASVNPSIYKVGPGDQFLVTIWATLENSIPAMVTPEGKLVIPTVGAVDVNGKFLDTAKQLVKEATAQKYINSEVTVDLIAVRQIRVHVTGQVLFPGVYDALPVHRVSDVIDLAGGLTSGAHERGIQVRHNDGSTDIVDLFRYIKLGDLGANLFLNGGDVVYIPTVDTKKPTVKVVGIINDPGVYQIKENESINDFLLRVDGLNRRADLINAFIERADSTNGALKTIPIFPYLSAHGNGHSKLILEDGDQIKLPQRDEDVYVIGAVQKPGPYPFIPNLTAQDYIGFAGASYQSDKITKTRVFKKNSNKEKKGKNTPVNAGDTVYIQKKPEFGPREIISIITQTASLVFAMRAAGVFN